MIKASQVRSVEFENHPNVEVPNKKMKLSASEDTTKYSIVEVRKNEDEDCRWSSPSFVNIIILYSCIRDDVL